jgi:hypothetical protein
MIKTFNMYESKKYCGDEFRTENGKSLDFDFPEIVKLRFLDPGNGRR